MVLLILKIKSQSLASKIKSQSSPSLVLLFLIRPGANYHLILKPFLLFTFLLSIDLSPVYLGRLSPFQINLIEINQCYLLHSNTFIIAMVPLGKLGTEKGLSEEADNTQVKCVSPSLTVQYTFDLYLSL